MNKLYLIVAPAWIGDMVMAQTLYKIIKQQNPDAIIDVLAPSYSAPLVARMPEVRQLIALPLGHGDFNLITRIKIARQLKKTNYQQAIVLPNSWKSALIPYIAGIKHRTGWLGEMRFGLLNDLRILDKKKYLLMIERFAALGFSKNQNLSPLPKLPWPALVGTPKKCNKQEQPILAICPGAEFGPAKRWPAQYYATIANEKLLQGWQVWIIGSHKESADANEIQKLTESRCQDFTGKTSLDEAIDLLASATVVVSNDSGLMHITAALKKPLVVVYGSSSANFTPPLSNQVKILSLHLKCSPCFARKCPLGHLDCLVKLEPSIVLKALDDLCVDNRSLEYNASAC